ncbi:DUF6343 family protein [Streptomyces sp. ME19-03-3]|nr:DUF6343 family protein [Streptomyces sp. ME19-03-3]
MSSSQGRPPVPRSRSGFVGRRYERTGTEPVTARSALGLRLALVSLFAPLFVLGTALFATLAARAASGDSPGRGTYVGLAVVCAVLAVAALLDLSVIMRRRRQENPRR